jgi:hypothetical protein
MTRFGKLVDNPVTYIGIVLALCTIGFGLGLLIGAL